MSEQLSSGIILEFCNECVAHDLCHVSEREARIAALFSENAKLLALLAKERDEFGKKETELKHSLAKCRAGLEKIRKHYEILEPKTYRQLSAWCIADGALEGSQ